MRPAKEVVGLTAAGRAVAEAVRELAAAGAAQPRAGPEARGEEQAVGKHGKRKRETELPGSSWPTQEPAVTAADSATGLGLDGAATPAIDSPVGQAPAAAGEAAAEPVAAPGQGVPLNIQVSLGQGVVVVEFGTLVAGVTLWPPQARNLADKLRGLAAFLEAAGS